MCEKKKVMFTSCAQFDVSQHYVQIAQKERALHFSKIITIVVNFIKIWVSTRPRQCHFPLSLKGLPLSLSCQNFKLTFSAAMWKSMGGKGEAALNSHLCFSYETPFHQKWNPKSNFWILLCKRRKRGILLETIWGVSGGKMINIWCASNNKEPAHQINFVKSIEKILSVGSLREIGRNQSVVMAEIYSDRAIISSSLSIGI